MFGFGDPTRALSKRLDKELARIRADYLQRLRQYTGHRGALTELATVLHTFQLYLVAQTQTLCDARGIRNDTLLKATKRLLTAVGVEREADVLELYRNYGPNLDAATDMMMSSFDDPRCSASARDTLRLQFVVFRVCTMFLIASSAGDKDLMRQLMDSVSLSPEDVARLQARA